MERTAAKRCICLITDHYHYRRDAFNQGIEAAGFIPARDCDPTPDDLLIIWNRYGHAHDMARRFEAVGAPVIVAENGYLGNSLAGDRWYAMSLNYHNGAGKFPVGNNERWDSLNVEILPWRENGREIMVLCQRGIGCHGVAQPTDWIDNVAKRLKGRKFRIRRHPGRQEILPLEIDLKDAKAVITWGSGAAIKALLAGIPCFHAFPKWIGAPGSTHLDQADLDNPQRGDRLAMFRRLAWAQWRVSDIANGTAIKELLKEHGKQCTSQ